MGRKPSKHLNLPAGMRARRRRAGGEVYYYFDTGGRPRKEIPLGTDYVAAVQQWAQLSMAPCPVVPTFGYAVVKYLASPEFSSVGAGTQADYKFAIDKLLVTFSDGPLDQIKPQHLKTYLLKRSAESQHRAQREIAVMGMIFRFARSVGLTDNDPRESIKLKKLKGRREIDITDEMLDAVYAKGSGALREAIDLAYFTGQRPADVLKIAETDIRDGYLHIVQNKTGKALRIPVIEGLAELIERINERKRAYAVRVLYLLTDEAGRKMTRAKLRARFETARTDAGISGADFQFRDLRRKGGTDLREQAGKKAAQELLGHSTEAMTEHYTGSAGAKIGAIPLRKRRSASGK